MVDIYTNVQINGDFILQRCRKSNGESTSRKVAFNPTLYVEGKKGDWSTLNGKQLSVLNPGSIRETKEFLKSYDSVEGFKIYGNSNYIQQYISDTYKGSIKQTSGTILVYGIDIETTTENGFPNIRTANEDILLITVSNSITKEKHIFGTRPFDTKSESHTYYKCNDESDLLRTFISFWQMDYPDIVTGWNIEKFDIPYLVNRIRNKLGEDYIKRLSPWNMVFSKTITIRGRDEEIYSFVGISALDYIELYKKFTYTKQESYKLDFICEFELDERKLKNPGNSFKEFYTNYWDTFVEYNIRDVELVDKLEEKLRFIELVCTIAYYSKINYEDVFSPVKTWESIIYNYLLDRKIAIPISSKHSKTSQFEGAYVKSPLVGMHKWVASFDLNSLYPHLIMQYNMSPETITDYQLYCTVDTLLNQTVDTSTAKENNLAVSGNGWCYRKDEQGFLPSLMKDMYSDRSKHKKLMLKHEQEYQTNKTEALSKEIARLNGLQMALKILLNSAYGALGNNHFKYFDLRIAEGITLSGQLSIRWMENKINTYMNSVLKTKGVDYVIAVDTDSIYVDLEELVEQAKPEGSVESKIKYMDVICEKVFQPFIDKGYEELAAYMNAYEQKMIMKREVLADKGIWIAKKRYILNVHNSEGVQYAKPKKKVMGLEMVRSTTPSIVREKLKDSIDVILDGGVTELKKYVSDFKEEFFKLPVESISRPSGLSGMKTYSSGNAIYSKGTPIHVRGSLLYNFHLKRLGLEKRYELIQDDDKIKYVYVKKPNPFQEDVIAFTDTLPVEFGLDKFIDRDTQFNKVFVDALQIMVQPLGWSLDDSASLDDFF